MSISLPAVENGRLNLLLRLFPYLAAFILVLILWLPFGFKTTGLIEEWEIHAALDSGQQLFFVTPTSAMTVARGRPLEMLPFAVSYTLDPNSFTYYQVLMMLFFFGKLVVVYWLMLEFLPGHKLLAFLTGFLFVIYPADTGLFSLRTIHMHSAVLAYLFAAYLLVSSRRRQRQMRWLALFGAALFMLFSLWQYPNALPLALITPFSLLYFGRPKRHFWLSAGLWYASIAAAVFYSAWAIRQAAVDNSYDAQFIQQVILTREEFKRMLVGVWVAYQRQFTGWISAISELNYLSLFGLFVIVGIGVTAAVGWLLIRQRQNDTHLAQSRWRYIVLWGAGFVIIAAGIAPYIAVPILRFESFRAYLVAALGSAIILVLTLHLISNLSRRYRQVVFLGLALPFVGLAYINAYQQQQTYTNYSLEQQNVLQQVVKQAPQIAPDTAIAIIDPVGPLNRESIFYYGSRLQPALSILYGNPALQVYYCPLESSVLFNQSCRLEPDSLQITQITTAGPQVLSTLPYSKLLLYEVSPEGQINLLSTDAAQSRYQINGYVPMTHITSTTLPARVAALFSCDPVLSCYRSAPVVIRDTFDLSPTDEIGLGWRGVEVDDKLGVFRWSISKTATVKVQIKHSTDLALDFNVIHWVEDSVIDSLKLSVNGSDIPLSLRSSEPSNRLYHAIIPRDVLGTTDSNFELVFTVDHLIPVPNDRLLGFALNDLHIQPAG